MVSVLVDGRRLGTLAIILGIPVLGIIGTIPGTTAVGMAGHRLGIMAMATTVLGITATTDTMVVGMVVLTIIRVFVITGQLILPIV